MVRPFAMYIPTDIRRRILKSLFRTGVLVIKDDPAGIHPELKCLNIYPYQLCRQLKDKKLVTKYYSWSHAYYTLTDDGLSHLSHLFGAPSTMPRTRMSDREAEVLEGKMPPTQRRGQ